MIYVEEEILGHPRALQILARFPDAEIVPCARYGEVFNRRAQHFRLQKRRPSLILARKHRNFVQPAPEGFGIEGTRSFLFSHLHNCIYDCRYCFLQGMYRSAHYVVFINYEDFQWAIEERVRSLQGAPAWFFSGYDCDSLALEPVTRFAASFVPFFARFPRAFLELRTKSTQIKSLLDMEAPPNVIVAFSFTPEEVAAAVESLTPAVDRRIRAMERLQERGWRLGLRFDPLIWSEGFRDQYRRLYEAGVRSGARREPPLREPRARSACRRTTSGPWCGSIRRTPSSARRSRRRMGPSATGAIWRRRWWGSAGRSCCGTSRRRSSIRA